MTSALTQPIPNVYTDLGVADENADFRALMGFPIQSEDQLAADILRWTDPTDSQFRNNPSASEWVNTYAPTQDDYDYVHDWLIDQGFAVNFEADNRLLMQFSGTVGTYNTAFETTLHNCERKNPQQGDDSFIVYCSVTTMSLPVKVANRVTGIVSADLPADPGPLPGEAGDVVDSPPWSSDSFLPADVASIYGVEPLWNQGYHGEGARLGVAIGGMFKFNDVGSFWLSSGITRSDPVVVQTMEPVPSRNGEATLDVSWSGGVAWGADMTVYAGPDSRDTSMIYTFNQAIASDAVDVLTDSFSHREDSEPDLVRRSYNDASMEAASLGITVVAAAGDSSGVDVPCDSPYVTCVGGSTVESWDRGAVSESTWDGGGTGESGEVAVPSWQKDVLPSGASGRGVADVACSAGNGYFMYYLGDWYEYYGTSFASPVFAGTMAVVDGWRKQNGMPGTGYLNPILYSDTAVQASFRDITSGRDGDYRAGVGWDYPTGWGAPDAQALATALP